MIGSRDEQYLFFLSQSQFQPKGGSGILERLLVIVGRPQTGSSKIRLYCTKAPTRPLSMIKNKEDMSSISFAVDQIPY